VTGNQQTHAFQVEVAGAEWAAWHVFARWPVGPASRWAATSNVAVGQTTYAANKGRVGLSDLSLTALSAQIGHVVLQGKGREGGERRERKGQS